MNAVRRSIVRSFCRKPKIIIRIVRTFKYPNLQITLALKTLRTCNQHFMAVPISRNQKWTPLETTPPKSYKKTNKPCCAVGKGVGCMGRPTHNSYGSSLFVSIDYSSSLFVTIGYCSSLFVSIDYCSSLFVSTDYCSSLLVTDRHYSSLLITVRHYSSLLITVRHYWLRIVIIRLY